MSAKSETLTLWDRLYRRAAPEAYRRAEQRRAIRAALAPWGGANLSVDHALWREALFKHKNTSSSDDLTVYFNSHAYIPLKIRTGTADPNPFRQVFLEQQYQDVIALAPDARTILDLGANVGYTAVWFAIRFPAATICAVEPLPENVGRIQRQIAAAELIERVTVIQAAADGAPGQAEFFTYDDGFFHTSGSLIADTHHQRAAALVDCLTIPQLIERAGWTSADVIKIDIEGAETRLFTEGADVLRPLLDSTRVFAVELHTPEAEAAARTFFSGWRSIQRGEITCFHR